MSLSAAYGTEKYSNNFVAAAAAAGCCRLLSRNTLQGYRKIEVNGSIKYSLHRGDDPKWET